MRTLARSAAVSAAALLAVPLWAVPALAETVSEGPSNAAYFNSAGVAQPEQSPIKPPNPVASVDGVSPGNLGVAAQGGREDKVSFLFFSLTSVPVDAIITRATLTVPLAPSTNADMRLNATPEKVAACAPSGSAFTDEDGEALLSAPMRACDVFKAVGTAAGDAAYTFDITSLATTWLTANEGVALTRDPAKQDTFQVVFTKDAVLDLEYTPAAPVATTDTGTASTGTTSVGTTDVGSGTASVGGFDSGSFTSDLAGTTSTAVAAPLVGAALPSATAPETATDSPAVAASPIASAGPIEMLSPTPAFWLGALLLAGVLGLLGLIMGDRSAAASAAAGSPSRLTRALSAPAGARPSLLGTSSS